MSKLVLRRSVQNKCRSFDCVWRENAPNAAQDDSNGFGANFRLRTPILFLLAVAQAPDAERIGILQFGRKC